MGASRFVEVDVPAICVERDAADRSVFLSPLLTVAKDSESGEDVGVRFGGHRELDDQCRSTVVNLVVGNKPPLTLSCDGAETLGMWLVRLADRARIVVDHEPVVIDLTDCEDVDSDVLDPDVPEDLARAANWPLPGVY